MTVYMIFGKFGKFNFGNQFRFYPGSFCIGFRSNFECRFFGYQRLKLFIYFDKRFIAETTTGMTTENHFVIEVFAKNQCAKLFSGTFWFGKTTNNSFVTFVNFYLKPSRTPHMFSVNAVFLISDDTFETHITFSLKKILAFFKYMLAKFYNFIFNHCFFE